MSKNLKKQKNEFELKSAKDVEKFFNNKPQIEMWNGKKRLVVRRPDGKLQAIHKDVITKNTDIISLTKQFKSTQSFKKGIKVNHLSKSVSQIISKKPLNNRTQVYLEMDFFSKDGKHLGKTYGVSQIGNVQSGRVYSSVKNKKKFAFNDAQDEAKFHAMSVAKSLGLIDYADVENDDFFTKIRSRSFITYK